MNSDLIALLIALAFVAPIIQFILHESRYKNYEAERRRRKP